MKPLETRKITLDHCSGLIKEKRYKCVFHNERIRRLLVLHSTAECKSTLIHLCLCNYHFYKQIKNLKILLHKSCLFCEWNGPTIFVVKRIPVGIGFLTSVFPRNVRESTKFRITIMICGVHIPLPWSKRPHTALMMRPERLA